LPLASSSCRPPECPPRVGSEQWSNASCTVNVTPDVLQAPSSARDIVLAVQAAAAAGKSVRMTGSGHSYSDIAVSRDRLLVSQQLQRVLELDTGELKPAFVGERHLVRVQSGITLRQLNRALAARQLALENMGGYDAQTIAGVMMTATHGSGVAFGPIASQVASLQIVSDGGELLQIEPSQGITDCAKFKGKLSDTGSNGLPVRLIQDDAVFQAVVVSMGCMGIVYAVVLRAVDAFWLRERRTVERWEQLSGPSGLLTRFLAQPHDPGWPDHFEISVNPYARPDGQGHSCLLTQRWRLPAAPPTTPQGARRPLQTGHLLADPIVRNWAEGALVAHLDRSPPAVLSQTLDGFMLVLKDDEYVAPSYEVFNLGDINRFRVFGIEMAVDLSQTLAAVQLLFDQAGKELAQHRHHSVPVSLRFVRQADAFLAMQNGRDTTMVEIGMLVKARGSAELLAGYEQRFVKELSARPHWGLDLSILQGRDAVSKLYPRWEDWYRVYAALNAHGTFNGELTARLGISIDPTSASAPALATAARQCP